MEWKEVSWILRGRLRKKILLVLDKPKTATILSKEIKTHRSTISYVLKQMRGKDIVTCLDPDQPYNRFYKITQKGKKILKRVKNIKG